MADTSDENKTETETPKEGEGTQEQSAAAKKPDDLARIKKAHKMLQKERDDFKAKWEKHEKDLADAKLSAEEKVTKALREKEQELEKARQEAATAKREREIERAVSKLVTKHKLKDPDYGELVLKGWDPEGEDDLDTWVAMQKKRTSIAELFGKPKEEREVDEDGEDIVPKTPSGSSSKKGASNWEEKEREIAAQLYPNNKDRQEAYIKNIKKLKAERS